MALASSKTFWRKWACREKNLKKQSSVPGCRLPVLPKSSPQSPISKLSHEFARINTDQFLLLVPMVKIGRSQKGITHSLAKILIYRGMFWNTGNWQLLLRRLLVHLLLSWLSCAGKIRQTGHRGNRQSLHAE